jgi:hypothetical protein
LKKNEVKEEESEGRRDGEKKRLRDVGRRDEVMKR